MAKPKKNLRQAFRKVFEDIPYYKDLSPLDQAYMLKFVDEYHFGFFKPGVTHLHNTKKLQTDVSRARDSRRRCMMTRNERVAMDENGVVQPHLIEAPELNPKPPVKKYSKEELAAFASARKLPVSGKK